MSTVAYARGTIAADTQSNNGDLKFNAASPKIAIDSAGNLYGAVGRYSDVCKVIAAVNKQRETGGAVELPLPGKLDDYEVMVVFTDGRISVMKPGGEELHNGEIYVAIGSGCVAAYGALYAGATPQVAVGAAIAHVEGTGGRVNAIRSPEIIEHLSRLGQPVTKPSDDTADAVGYMFRARQLSSNAEHRASKNEPKAGAINYDHFEVTGIVSGDSEHVGLKPFVKPPALDLEPETAEQEFDRIAREGK